MKRTDLAIDITDNTGSSKTVKSKDGIRVTKIEISDDWGSKQLKRPKGTYYTIEFPALETVTDTSVISNEIIFALKSFFPDSTDNFLIVGLGNREITSDSIGPLTAERILASRHITDEFAETIGLKGLKSVAALTPGVLGKTGIETAEIVKGIVNKIKPQAVIVIDALASSSIFRLFKTVQITDAGILPGSGVKNSRKELSEKTLGIPVIAIGVPTVMDANEMAFELCNNMKPDSNIDMVITPKDCDLLSQKISDILSMSLNLFLQPKIDREVILSLV